MSNEEKEMRSGGPAFPTVGDGPYIPGMTLRAYTIADAMLAERAK